MGLNIKLPLKVALQQINKGNRFSVISFSKYYGALLKEIELYTIIF